MSKRPTLRSDIAADQQFEDKRTALLNQLTTGEYKPLPDVIFDRVGRLIQRLTHSSEPPTLIYSGVVMLLLILLIGCLVSLALNEVVTPEMILLALWGGILGGLVMGQAQQGNHLLLTTLRESTIPAMQTAANLDTLQRWLTNTFDLKRQILFSLLMSLGMGFLAPLLWVSLRGGWPGFGPMVGVILIWFQAGTGWYWVGPVLVWLSDLGHYRLKLYGGDPSNSEVIDRLGDVLNFLVFTGAILAALFTLGLMYFELLNPTVTFVFLVLGTWGPLATIFISSQYALARVISQTKWQKLGEIQAKIATLETEQDITAKETIEAINRLMDYHDRIQATRNSAMNFRSGLNFLNSLLLPLLAFILGNLDEVLAYF